MEDPQLRLDQEPLPPRVIKDLPIDPDAEDIRSGQGEAPEPVDGITAGSGPQDTSTDESPALAEAETEPADATKTTAASDDEASTPSATADEAAAPADVDEDAAEQDTEEYRA